MLIGYSVRAVALAFGLVFLSLAATRANAATYGFSDLYPLSVPVPYTYGYASEVITSGVTVGYAAVHRYDQNGAAIMWSSAGVPLLLPDAGLTSYAFAASGTHQVGKLFSDTWRAVIWNGSPTNYIDLQPALSQFSATQAFGTNGSQQVGDGTVGGGAHHAAMWNGTAASCVDLGLGFDMSVAVSTNGVYQVGSGREGPFSWHAIMWKGSPTSYVDLTPAGVINAYGVGISSSGNQQVGYADVPAPVGVAPPTHALVWSGNAQSAVELNPAGYLDSQATATNGVQQIGYAGQGALPNNGEHAFVWSGTAASAIDLGAVLPAGWMSSQATSLDSAGDVFGFATDPSGTEHAVEWIVVVPEPLGTAAPLFIAATFLMRRRQMRRAVALQVDYQVGR